MATDFIDNDLLHPANPPRVRSESVGGGFSQAKRRVEEEESRASDEIERIRKRSQEVERQRQALRTLRERQLEFDRSFKELTDGLKRHSVLLKEEERQASRAATVCHEVRTRLETVMEDMRNIDPDSWSEERHEQELTHALAQIEAAKAVFRKGLDKVAAIGWNSDGSQPNALRDALAEQGLSAFRFRDWVKIGFAITLPIIVLALVVLLAYFFASHGGLNL